jgi:predicted Ser/Thr protein kinase
MSNLVGQTLGPYRIIEQIGIGGMATVYKAYQPSMDRYVAIKVLPAVLARDAAFLKRFQREAKVVAKLEHKHILPVHDYGEQEGLTYLVMRYVEAGTLKDRLAAGQLDLPEIYRIIAQVGAALDYAHRLGVIHRDVKPSNVLIDSQGDVYLTDFGLARIMESSDQLTATGVGVGTPAYMAPEQGQGLKIDHRSDVYSLGVMLYEMVTGQVPYRAETPMAVVIKHITEPLPLPRQIVPDLPEEIERVVLKALAKKPEDRFQTVREMVEALDLAVRAAIAAAPAARAEKKVVPPVPAAPVRKFRWPWGVRTTALGVGIAALALLVIGGLVFAMSRVQYRVQVVGGRVEVVPVSTEAVSPTPTVALVETPTGQVALATTATAAPEPTTVPATTPAPEGECRIVYEANGDIYVRSCSGSYSQRLTDHPASDWLPTWSPDGTRIVFTSDRDAVREGWGQLHIVDADGSNLTRLTYTERNDEHPSWSPDGNRIAFHSWCDLAVVNPDGSNWTTLVEGDDDLCVGYPTWSPDGHRIAFRSLTRSGDSGPYQHDIYIVNDDGAELLKLATFTSEEWGLYVVWSPDGSRVAFDVILDGQQRYYAVNSDGSGEPVEISVIPDSWYPWYWPQWGGEVQTATASTMAAQARAFAEPILAAIAGRPPDFEDDFEDPRSEWRIESGVSGEMGYQDGEYYIIANPHPDYPQECCGCYYNSPPGDPWFSDFVLEVDLRVVSGDSDHWDVFFRRTDASTYAAMFSLSHDLTLMKMVTEPQEDTGLATHHGPPISGGSETNHLQIIARGPQMAVYVNGEPLWLVADTAASRGQIVLGGCSHSDIPLHIRYDNLRIWDISDLSLPSVEVTPTATPAKQVGQEWANLRSFPAPAAEPSGIIRVADSLWVIASRGRRLYRLNLEGSIIGELDFISACNKVAWDGESLWCAANKTVYKVDPASGQELTEFEIEMSDVRGIAWDGSALWIVDGDGNLVCYDRDGQRLRRLAVAVNGWPIGLAWGAGELWVADVHGKVTRFDSEFAKIGSFSLDQCGAGPFPYDLALYWDGESLWLADSNQNRILQCAPAG